MVMVMVIMCVCVCVCVCGRGVSMSEEDRDRNTQRTAHSAQRTDLCRVLPLEKGHCEQALNLSDQPQAAQAAEPCRV